MAVFIGSRYANLPVLTVPISATSFGIAIYRPTPAFPQEMYHYTVVFGDRFDLLANRFYNDPKLWWVIADANPEIFYPDDLTPGSIIRIPL